MSNLKRQTLTIDGNEAAAYIAHKLSEVIAIYPITPSSAMGEWSDEWSSKGQSNIWGSIPSVVEMQSEAGAVGAIHGALQTGALTTTFTSSQGLLLMIPNMYKMAGELSSTVFHVAARSVATHALSIFGDHSDVMAVRSSGWGQLCSHSVQEVMDMALIAHAATLEARIPMLHFFDGFRTSHEVMKIEQLSDADIRAMIDEKYILEHRTRALSPEKPFMRGSAQNPDVFFQSREAVNPFYFQCPDIIQKYMDKFASITGRKYRLFDYFGSPDAERVIVIMGSGAMTAQETVYYLNSTGEKVGVIKVHLFRPFAKEYLVKALPSSVKSIAVLDRTKEPGGAGEPLYQDVITALTESFIEGNLPFAMPKIIGGRYGLSSKEFTPAMVKAIFDELKLKTPKNHFTVGIFDDVSHTSFNFDKSFSIERSNVVRAIFYGLGADGTVGANKNSIKIIGEDTDFDAQGYFVYDSKKSGSVTVSHLRFGPKSIQAPYLITSANFVACHQFSFLEKYDMLRYAEEGAVFLLNSPFTSDMVWSKLPAIVQSQIITKKVQFYCIDGYRVAKETGMGGRFNTIMQTCFFAISGVLPKEQAIDAIKRSIEKTYGKKGKEIVRINFNAVDMTLANLFKIDYPNEVTSQSSLQNIIPENAPEYVKKVTIKMISGDGDDLPVSAMPVDGTFPSDTARWEKRNIALEIPVWNESICIQCNKCALVCPHAAIRTKVYPNEDLKDHPVSFKNVPYKGKEFNHDMSYTVQVAPEDCTGCGLCVDVCPVKNKQETRLKAINMMEQEPLRDSERINWAFFINLPEADRRQIPINTVKGSQFLQPLFEFSGACSACGETPYLKLVSQLFGDRALIANATGCSSIYGGNLPTTPWAQNKDGRGPAWSNSLFEDNAEFGLGYRLTADKQTIYARELVERLAPFLDESLVKGLLHSTQKTEVGIYEQRERVKSLKKTLNKLHIEDARRLLSVADFLVRKSVWIVGGDGWAYDIGYGGLDHVLASGRNVNILVLDTEVYSNTGGQMSKSTNRGAVAKFASGGKRISKKDLGLMAMSAGHVYVAQIAMGANDAQTVKALLEAEAYDGPSIVIAYSHCIAHGINMGLGLHQQKAAVDSGHWLLYRYNPELADKGQNPLILDCKAPSIAFKDYAYQETRYKMLALTDPDSARILMESAQNDIVQRWHFYEQMTKLNYNWPSNGQKHD